MKIREYLFLRQAEYRHLQKTLAKQTAQWVKEWIPQSVSGASYLFKQIKVNLIGNIVTQTVEVGENGAALRFIMTQTDYQSFMQMLTQSSGKDCEEGLSNDLLQHIHHACLADLSKEITLDQYEISVGKSKMQDDFHRKRDPGEILGVCEMGSIKLYLLLNAKLLKILCGRENRNAETETNTNTKTKTKTVAIKDLLTEQTTQLKVTVGSTKITLSELQKLIAGDVVILDQTLDKPSEISIGSHPQTLQGVLMRNLQHRAIKFI